MTAAKHRSPTPAPARRHRWSWRHARAWWAARSAQQRHWFWGVALGIAIDIGLHLAGHSALGGWLTMTQNMGQDAVTQLNQTLCAKFDPGVNRRGIFDRLLRCPGSDGEQLPPLLVEVTEKDWRDPNWGGGEPVQAPRARLAEVVEQVFKLGAPRVVLDVLIEDPPLAGDADFATALVEMMAQGKPFAGRGLVLVRSERWPLERDEGAFLPEMRPSTAIDPVVARLGEMRSSSASDPVVASRSGRVILAAPYFQRSADRVTRDWALFRTLCQRLPGAPGQGRIAVLPSVQLAIRALLASEPEPFQVLRRFSPLPGAAAEGAAMDAGTPPDTVPCTPMPARGPADLQQPDRDLQACRLARSVAGAAEAAKSPACQSAAAQCAGANADSRACAGAKSGSPASTDGVNARYWQGLREALRSAPYLGPLPAPGELGNRIAFRIAPDMASRWSVRHLEELGRTADDAKLPFAGRTVVIGQTHALAGDEFDTPLGRMPGSVLLVNSIDSMAEHGLIEPPPGWLTGAMALVGIAVVAYFFAYWPSRLGALAATAVIGAVFVPLSAMLMAYGVWLNFVAPMLGIVVHGLVHRPDGVVHGAPTQGH